MATAKIKKLPQQSGNLKKDYENLYKYLQDLTKELEYVLNNIDDKNFTTEINNKIK